MQKEVKHRTGIRLKLTLVIFITTLIIGILCIGLGYFWGFNLIRNIVGNERVQIAELVTTSIVELIETEIKQISLFSTRRGLIEDAKEANLKYQAMDKDAIGRYLVDMDKKWIEAPDNSPLIKEYLESQASEDFRLLIKQRQEIAEVFITDKFGGLVASSGRTTDFYQADEKWWQDAFDNGRGKVAIEDIEFDESSGKLGLPIVIPIKDEKREVIGICKVIVDINIFFEPLVNFKIGKTGHTVLIDSKDNIIFHPGIKPFSAKFASKQDLERIAKSNTKWFVIKNPHIHKENIMVAFAEINLPVLKEQGIIWRVFIDASAKEVFAPLNMLIFQMLIIVGILIIVLIPTGFIVGGIFIRPIKKLYEGTEHIGKGDLNYRVEVKTNDEIGQLADSFNKMAQDLKETTTSMENLNKEIAQRKQAEEALSIEKEHLAVTLQSIGDGVIATDTQGKIIFINKVAESLTGWGREEAIGKPLGEVFHIINEKTRRPCEDPVVRVLKTGEIVGLGNHTILIAKDGTERALADSAAPIHDRDGNVIGVVLVFRDVTEFRKIEEALQNSERKFRAIFNQTFQFIGLMKLDGTLIDANKTALDFAGYKASDVMGKPFWETPWWSHSVELQNRLRVATKEASGGKIVRFEATHPAKDGTIRYVDFSIKPVMDESGNIIFLIPEGRDITERKHAEEAAQQLAAIVESSEDAIISKTLDGTILTWNKGAGKLYGYCAEEVKGRSISILIPPDHSEEPSQFLAKIKRAESVENYETVRITKDGRRVDVSVSISPIKDANGKIVGASTIARDITELRRKEETLQELSRAVEQSPSIVVITDTKGNIEYVNPKFSQLTGYAPEEVIGKNPRILKSGELPVRLYEELWHTITSGEEWRGEFYNKKKNGQYYWEAASISPIRDQKGIITHFLKVSEDVTERKRLEGIKDEFVSTVSHELRTPLSITKEGISLVLDKIPGDINEKQTKILTTAMNNIDRLARIINELLDISKIESGKLELKKDWIDIKNIIEHIASSFELKVKEKGLRLKLNLPKREIKIYADADKINQVFTNLMANAVRFTQKGFIEISVYEEGNTVECSVADTGIGIAKEDLPNIFSKFQQFGRTVGDGEKGTGLGLSIAKGIVEMHNGQIRAESQSGKGSKFSFTLPRYTPETLFKEHINIGIKEALDKSSKVSLIVVSILDFNKLLEELSVEKLHSILKNLEDAVKNSLRRAGDVVIKDTGELVIILPGCDKESALRIEGRITQILEENLTKDGLYNKIKLKFGSATYPDEAKDNEDLIKKAKQT